MGAHRASRSSERCEEVGHWSWRGRASPPPIKRASSFPGDLVHGQGHAHKHIMARRTGPSLLALLVVVLLVAPSSEKKLLKLALLMSGGTTFIPIPVPLNKKVEHTKLVPYNIPYPVPVPVHTHEHVRHGGKHAHVNYEPKHDHSRSKVVVIDGDRHGGGHYGGGHYGGGYYDGYW
ncbi:uncharacterized protein [Dermacentor albipictus]|uniref:uncharacterized protein n=1 Tax=Dermacentor albipictus TaxID=60249 RepID=UPI0031FBADA6